MLIKTDVIGKIRDNVTNLLQTYTKELNAAMDDNDGVDISLPIKVRQGGSKLDIQVGINFIKIRVKDSVIFAVSDQKELFAESNSEN